MNNISIQTIQDTLVVDSRLVAAELGILHKNFKELIKTYKVDFEEFGHLCVMSAGVKGTSSYAEFYYLNENQAYLSLTYSNNTPQVRRAKINLVKAFDEARNAIQSKLPGNYLSALKALVASEEEKQALALEAAELRPKAESWERLCGTNGLMTIGEVAKNLAIPGLGPNKLFQLLRDKGYVYYNYQGCNVPKSTLVERKYMKSVEKYDFKRDKKYSVCAVTYKGYEFIVRLLKRLGYLPNGYNPNEAALALPDQLAA